MGISSVKLGIVLVYGRSVGVTEGESVFKNGNVINKRVTGITKTIPVENALGIVLLRAGS